MSGSGQGEQQGAALGVSFGTAMWLAIFLHLVGVEIYLNLTPAETHRLRQVSYQKQLEAGLPNPGSAGLTSDRWGDSLPWAPSERHVEMATHSAYESERQATHSA
ncbi:hypothetical protein CBOM_01606 [Ceraceosorus bombacis]|uniref:Uncharacterized protein n=1 Tax=Ceraceosorus bombacis TaxID=401625 RepID=A0A0P1BCA7_9BASI|nr:hypothetical protein CBOM_01606 [Ceraceosorus bombacis]